MGKISRRAVAVVGAVVGILTFRKMRKYRADAAREEKAEAQTHDRAETAREHANAAAEHARLAAEKSIE